jgi:hypothetical protein
MVHSPVYKKIKKLEHAKGVSWIHQNGIDVNLGGYDDQRCSFNNRLTSVMELQDKSDDDIRILVVSGAKGDGDSFQAGQCDEEATPSSKTST